MARQLFMAPQEEQRQRQKTDTRLDIRTTQKQKSGTRLSQMEIERVLNRKRSKEYVEAMKRLDAGGHMHNQRMVEELVKLIQEEMPEIELDMGPIGIVSKCYLGDPYVVHTLDVNGAIIEHFESYRNMPGELERARKLACSGFYAFIEVYHNSMRAVKDDGSVAVLKE